MATELFGATRAVNPIGQIAGSEFARIFMGTAVALAQSFSANYGRPSKPVMSIGDPNIYFVPGQGQGNVAVGRLLGADGLFSLINSTIGTCGTIQNLQLAAGSGRCMVAPTQTLNFGGAIMESLAIGMQSNSPEIIESYNVKVSTLERI